MKWTSIEVRSDLFVKDDQDQSKDIDGTLQRCFSLRFEDELRVWEF